MAQPAEYKKNTTFSTLTNSAIPAKLDAEFTDVKTTTDQIRANLALIQNDSGTLKDGSITKNALSQALINELKAQSASSASEAASKASEAISTANRATEIANGAVSIATTADLKSQEAMSTAEEVEAKVDASFESGGQIYEALQNINEAVTAVGQLDTKVSNAIAAQNIESRVAVAVETALSNTQIEGLTSQVIVGTLGYTPADGEDLDAEIADRESADNTLQANITAEAGTRASADEALGDRIDGLATVATTGSYNDLSNKPTIPTVPTALSSFTDDLGSSPAHTHSQYLTSTNISGLATSASVTNEATARSQGDATLLAKFSSYLPLAGGTLTGQLKTTAGGEEPIRIDGIGAGAYRDIVTYRIDTNNRVTDIRSTAGNEANYLLLGVSDENNSAPSGVSISRNLSSGVVGITLSGTTSSEINQSLCRNVNNNYLGLSGSTGFWDATGANLFLYGAGNSSSGIFNLRASNSSANKSLIGYPSGQLTWAGGTLSYVAGNTLYYRGYCAGIITSSSKDVVFTVPVSVPNLASSASVVTSTLFTIRHADGAYLNSTSSGTALSSMTKVSQSCYVCNGGVLVSLTRNSAWTKSENVGDTSAAAATNNSVVAVYFNGSIKLS